jgi:hypothetical protein
VQRVLGDGMSPTLAEAVDVARNLAWLPIANLSNALRYRERRELHARLGELLSRSRLHRDPSPEARFLVAAMRRVAAATFVNRYGLPYYERRAAVTELRGCLDAYDRLQREAA